MPHLWRWYRSQKLGILDIALELNDDTKVKVELQGSRVEEWIRLFNAKGEGKRDILATNSYRVLKRST